MGLQGLDHSDQTVATHPEGSGVVEEDHSGDRIRFLGLGQQRTDHGIVTAGLAYHGPAQMILVASQPIPPIRHRAVFDFGPTTDDDPRRLALGMRVDDLDRFGEPGHCRYCIDSPPQRTEI